MEKKESAELGIWLKTFFIFIFAIGSSVFFFLYLNRYVIFNRAAGSSGGLTFVTQNITAQNGGLFSTQIIINTDKMPIKGTDVRIKFDKSKLELVQVMPLAQGTTSLKTFLPLRDIAFDGERVVDRANRTGFVEFSAISADMATQQATPSFKGVAVLALLTFRSIQPGDTGLAIVREHPSYDSTIIEDINPPLNILTNVNRLMVHSVDAVSSPSPRMK